MCFALEGRAVDADCRPLLLLFEAAKGLELISFDDLSAASGPTLMRIALAGVMPSCKALSSWA